jgi:hypothetical protein
MPPPFHSDLAPLPTGLSLPPPPLTSLLGGGCLTADSVAAFGASGNPAESAEAALRAADQSSATSVLYLPPGVYRISASLQLLKPVVSGELRCRPPLPGPGCLHSQQQAP